MQNFIRFSFISCLWIFLISSSGLAYSAKEGNVTATFGPFFSKTNFASSPTGAQSPILGGFGVIANGDVNENGALEIGMIHMNKIFFRQQGSDVMAEETEMMHITMGYRRWLLPKFSAGLTFYSSYSMGDVRVIHNDFPYGQELDTSARDGTEYGLDFSLRAEVWSQDNYAVVIDTKYAYSVTNKANEKGDHYGVLIGFRYLVQGKRESVSANPTQLP